LLSYDVPELVEATEKDTEPETSGAGKTLHLRELSVIELNDPDLKRFAKLVGELSIDTVFIATEDDEEDLSGTVLGDWMLEKLILRDNHSDLYAAARISGAFGQLTENLQARVYTLQNIPKGISKYRRRNMKRLCRSAGYIQTSHHNGKAIVFYISTEESEEGLPFRGDMVTTQTKTDNVPDPNSKTPATSPLNPQDRSSAIEDIKTVATGASLSAKEKARVKQQQRRQRKRSEKRNQLETHTAGPPESSDDSNGAKKRHRPSPDERSMKFLRGLLEFDSPQIDASATNEELEAALSSSKILLRTKVDRIPHRSFTDRPDLAEFVDRVYQEVLFLTKQHVRLSKFQAQPLPSIGPAKLEYVARLLWVLIGAPGGGTTICHVSLQWWTATKSNPKTCSCLQRSPANQYGCIVI
jgi:hypothetical protein